MHDSLPLGDPKSIKKLQLIPCKKRQIVDKETKRQQQKRHKDKRQNHKKTSRQTVKEKHKKLEKRRGTRLRKRTFDVGSLQFTQKLLNKKRGFSFQCRCQNMTNKSLIPRDEQSEIFEK